MHRRRLRGQSRWLGGVAVVVAGTLFGVFPGAGGYAEAAAGAGAGAGAGIAETAGATTPFVTVEAESGTLGGAARVRSIRPGATVPTSASLETEASGNALERLPRLGLGHPGTGRQHRHVP
ncbi:hypothetical protein [Streptomyces sp. NPDC048445]|uniref:hypothetical protein n=1 Tax=Streptomyces sp. NPDC048445 TaxID=3365553 RepID=UPI0037210C3F